MSDDERELLQLENRLIEVLTDVVRLRIRTSQKSPRVAQYQADLPGDLIEVGNAAKLAQRPPDTVRRWCRENLFDSGGFAMRLKGRWFVSRRLFVEFLRAPK